MHVCHVTAFSTCFAAALVGGEQPCSGMPDNGCCLLLCSHFMTEARRFFLAQAGLHRWQCSLLPILLGAEKSGYLLGEV